MLLNKYKYVFNLKACIVALFLFSVSFIVSIINVAPTHAAYVTSLSTSGTINLDVSPSGNGANVTADDIKVTSTCPLGYTLSISGPADTTLYKNGDKTNNTNTAKINSSSGTKSSPASILNSNINTWGYTTSAAVLSDIASQSFIGLTNATAEVVTKTTYSGDGSGSSATGVDTIPVYYGASVSYDIEPGTYKLAESTTGAGDNVITYYLTANPNCNVYTVRYNGNNADTSTTMSITHNNVQLDQSITLYASNFKKPGYGFAGWSTTQLNPDATDATTKLKAAVTAGVVYGPNETITASQSFLDKRIVENGQQYINLYAVWIKSAGNIQGWNNCSSMTVGEVTALTDQRDNNTYAVAKLADGKCWMIENLRLTNTTNAANSALSQGFASNFKGLANAENDFAVYANVTTANSLYSADGASGTTAITGTDNGYRFPRYYSKNTQNTVASMTAANQNVYSYGNYYTWSAAVADTGYYNTTNQNITGTSICPAGWSLPSGGTVSSTVNVGTDTTTFSDYYLLGYKIMDNKLPVGNATSPAYDNTVTNNKSDTAAKAFRRFPNNFVNAGNVSSAGVNGIGTNATYYTSTVSNNQKANDLHLSGTTSVNSGTGSNLKAYARLVRCMTTGSYAVTFNANGGSGTMTNQIISNDRATALKANSFTAPSGGYTFAGWNTKSDGSGTNYSNQQSVTNLGNITLYAKWTYAVTFNANGGTGTMGNQTILRGKATALTANAFSLTNYSFAGWNTKADGSGTSYTNQQSVTSLGNITLYAQWTYKVTFNANGGTGTTNAQTIKRGVATALTANGYTAPSGGYTFAGWNTKSDGSGTNYSNQQSVTNLGNITLYAKWTYKITYMGNNGIVSTFATQTAVRGQATTLNSSAIDSPGAGFTLNGWNTKWDGTGTNYNRGQSVTNLGNITLYANWQCMGGYVCYGGGGANPSANINEPLMGTQSISSSATSITLLAPNLKRTDYGFVSWNTKPDGTGTNYGPNQTINITAGQYNNSGLRLYAKWVVKAGNLQNWTGCSSLSQGSVTALMDTRNNDTYAVAKLADGKCWMIENLRLGGSSATTISYDKSNFSSGNFILPASSNSWCNESNATCVNQSKLNASNIISSNGFASRAQDPIYRYGNYYNWYTATAGTGTYNVTSGNATGSICPKGWRLPTGGNNGEFKTLETQLANYKKWGEYPNNFISAGAFDSDTSSVSSRGGWGFYWSSTANGGAWPYIATILNGSLNASVFNLGAINGYSVRCVAGS